MQDNIFLVLIRIIKFNLKILSKKKFKDSRPCQTDLSIDFKRTALAINLCCILICFILVFLIWYHMSLMVTK
jgi:hypothetical protein